jgi:hypothetical protein
MVSSTVLAAGDVVAIAAPGWSCAPIWALLPFS